jgi:hypothetical protein
VAHPDASDAEVKLKLPRFCGVIEGLADYGSVVAMWPSVS